MLERLVEQKRAIAIYCQDNDGVKNLTPNEWNLMERVLLTLRPFEQETKNASMSSATAGMIIPSVRVLLATLMKPVKVGDDVGIQTMRSDMMNDLSARYAEVERNKVCVLATILDPTYKLLVFNPVERVNAKASLLAEVRIKAEKMRSNQIDAISSDPDLAPVASTSLESYYQEFFASCTSNNLDATPASGTDYDEIKYLHEINSYLAEPKQPRTSPPTDPVIYWKSRQHTYPHLAAVARRFCATPPSSVDSERTFSTSGAICDDKRSCMSASKMEMLLFVQKNLEVVKFEY